MTTPVAGQALEPTTVGTKNSHGRFARLYLADEAFLYQNPEGDIVHVHVDPATGSVHETPVSGQYGETVHFDGLTVATGDTYRRWPVRPYVNAVYFTGADGSVRDLQVPVPAKFVKAVGRDRPMFIHNEADGSGGDDDVLRLRDWNGDTFFHLLPGERIEFLVRQKEHGQGECISAGEVPERRMLYGLTYNNPLGALSAMKRLDATDPENGDFYVLTYPTGTYSFQQFHEDYFETGSDDYANDTDIEDITTEADFFKTGAWKIKAGTTGILRANLYGLFRKSSGASGSWTNPRFQFYRFDGTDVDIMLDQVIQNVWVAEERVPGRMVAEATVSKGDIFTPGIFRRGLSSLSADNAEVRELQVDISVTPRITLDYTP